MRNIFLAGLFTLTVFTACESSEKKEKKITARDVSITPAIAYNDLFLDTSTVSNFIGQEKLDVDLANQVRSFYNNRNFQFAWFASDGLTEQARSFWNVVNYKKDSALDDKPLRLEMKDLWTAENTGTSATDKSTVHTELLLTAYFMRYMLTNYDQGTVKKKDLESFIPRKKEQIMVLADSFANKKSINADYEQANVSYKALREQLVKYVDIAKKGGWPIIQATQKSYKKNTSDPILAVVKKHLTLIGDIPAGDTTPIYNANLEAGIKSYQSRMGYTPDGILTQEVIKEMNIPIQKRIQQLLINLDRMRWLPDGDNGKVIVTNIPEFKVHVYDGDKQEFEMPVVVGKDGHNTVIFTGVLSQVVFSPYWNVPPSIVKNEILPKLDKNKGYLEQENMEVVSNEGGLPVIRQKPGPKNSLGKVKFLFPNDFNIYFHDTPVKSLFKEDQRAYSHGCIRLADPVKMANYLLKDQPEWTPEKINEAMNAGKEKTVEVKNKVPVLITYYTAWVDATGKLNFRDDIYAHDASVAKKMFTNPL